MLILGQVKTSETWKTQKSQNKQLNKVIPLSTTKKEYIYTKINFIQLKKKKTEKKTKNFP